MSKNIKTLYHGTNHPDQINGSSYFFFSTDKRFAEDYGETLLECKVDVGNTFKTFVPNKIKDIYNAGFKLTDDYVTQSYTKDDEIGQFYDFEADNYPTAESFINGPFFGSDTWEAIEHTPGVVYWIFGEGYDSIEILEGGHLNYYTSYNNVLDRIDHKKENKGSFTDTFFDNINEMNTKDIRDVPEFLDPLSNPLMKNRPYPTGTQIAPQLSEEEISSQELEKKLLPMQYPHLFDDFVREKTEREIREIAPNLNINQSAIPLMKDIKKNYPSIYDNFAQWISDKKQKL